MSSIDYHRFRRGDRCSTTGCPSKYYYISDGQKICKAHGHVQEGFTQVQADEDDFGNAGKTTRRKRERTKSVAMRFEGRGGLGLYVECLQWVVRRQVEWCKEMGKVGGRGVEMEQVVRSLWAVRVRGVKGLDDGDGEESQGGFSSTSASEGESDAEGLKNLGQRMERRLKKVARDKGIPKLLETVGIVYLALVLMREPISFGDLSKWMVKGGFPYFRVIKDIPQDMKSHLPAQYIAALEPRAVLKPERLQEKVLNLVISLKRDYEIQFPPLNASLLMFKHVKDLCLPLEVFPCAFRLAKVLNLDFKYPELFAGQFRATDYPELRLMGLIVVSTKLLQPFDNITRKPEIGTDPITMRLRWESWKHVMAEKEVKGLKPGEELKVREEDVFEMNGEKLDDYLAWYQKTWMDDKEDKLPKQILDLFPLEEVLERQLDVEPPQPTTEKLKFVQSSLQVVDPITMEQAKYAAREVVRPGARYSRWKEVSRLSDIERLFMEKASEQAGCSLDILVKSVYMLETKIQTLVIKEDKLRRDMDNAVVISDDDSIMDEEDEGDDEL